MGANQVTGHQNTITKKTLQKNNFYKPVGDLVRAPPLSNFRAPPF